MPAEAHNGRTPASNGAQLNTAHYRSADDSFKGCDADGCPAFMTSHVRSSLIKRQGAGWHLLHCVGDGHLNFDMALCVMMPRKACRRLGVATWHQIVLVYLCCILEGGTCVALSIWDTALLVSNLCGHSGLLSEWYALSTACTAKWPHLSAFW